MHSYSFAIGDKIWPQYEQLAVYFLSLLLATSWPKLRFAILHFLITFLLLTTNTAL